MTVRELIEKLSKADPDRIVKVWDNHISGTREIFMVSGGPIEGVHALVWIEIR